LELVPRLCTACVHMPVCSVYIAVKGLIKSYPEEVNIFKPEELAAICKQYMPIHATKILRGA